MPTNERQSERQQMFQKQKAESNEIILLKSQGKISVDLESKLSFISKNKAIFKGRLRDLTIQGLSLKEVKDILRDIPLKRKE